jgi:hypothetical protein
MSKRPRPPTYRAYLLRFWREQREHPDLSSTWRFSLEDPQSGKRRGFANLEALTTFLRKATSEPDPTVSQSESEETDS